MTYLSTSEVATIENYPYGRLKCTMTKTVEFADKKGFRVVSQTTNPKTGRLNAPKKSTYYDLYVLTNTDGFIDSCAFSFNGAENIQKAVDFLTVNFNLFTAEQMTYIYGSLFSFLKVDMKVRVIYSGAKFDDLKPFFEVAVNSVLEGYRSKGLVNTFGDIKLNLEGIESQSVKDYKPFITSEAVNIMDL